MATENAQISSGMLINPLDLNGKGSQIPNFFDPDLELAFLRDGKNVGIGMKLSELYQPGAVKKLNSSLSSFVPDFQGPSPSFIDEKKEAFLRDYLESLIRIIRREKIRKV